jgi:hypothetical protein
MKYVKVVEPPLGKNDGKVIVKSTKEPGKLF